jgi:hypothetical protein
VKIILGFYWMFLHKIAKSLVNPNSHGVGHIGHTFFEAKLLRKTLSAKNFK